MVETLEQLGLSKNEALVYASLVSHSPAGASYLSKKCALARSSVYTALSSLVSKGLVGTSYKNEIKQFIAEDLDAVREMLEKEKAETEKRLQLFEKEQSTLKLLKADWLKIPNIVIFEGQEGLKKTYMSMMRQVEPGSVMYVMRDEFVWHPAWHFIFEKEWHERVKNIKAEKDIQTKLLVNDSKEERINQNLYEKRKGLSVRFLPKVDRLEKFAIYINKDTFTMLSFEKGNMVGIKITNKNLAENNIKIFESLWGKSKKLK